MDVVAWLNSPTGDEFAHAIIGLVLAVTAYLTWRTHDAVKRK